MVFVVKNDSIILLASAAVVRVSDNSNCISSITVRVQLYEIIYERGIDQNKYFSSVKKNPLIHKIEKKHFQNQTKTFIYYCIKNKK